MSKIMFKIMKNNVTTSHLSERLLENLITAVVCLDTNLTLCAINSAAEMLFGISRRYAVGLPLRNLPYLQALVPSAQAVFMTNNTQTVRALHLQRVGETPRTVDCTICLYQEGDTPLGLILEFSVLDQHLRISRDQYLHHQHETSRELVRGLAHEIKNPLGGLRGAAQLLEQELPPELHEFTRIIIGEADRLQRLVDRLLGPSRLPQYQSVNIHDPLEYVCQVIDAQLAKGIVIRRDYDPSLPQMKADREQLIQVFLNIIGNAIESLGEVGKICLRTRAIRQFTIRGQRHRLVASIEIIDNGPGISPDMLEKIFYPLITTKAKGSGLGLSIAQHLIHSHGGLIECKSQP